MPEPTHYEILGVAENAPDHIIKSAYRAHAKHSHPDTGRTTDADFGSINEAYEILSDPVKRAAYDKQLTGDSGSTADRQEGAADIGSDDFEDSWGNEDAWSPEYEYEPTDFATEDPRKLAGFDAWKTMPITPDQVDWLPDARRSQMNYVPLDRPLQPIQQPPEGAGNDGSTGKPGMKWLVWSIIWFVVAIAYSIITGRVNAGLFGMGAFVGAGIFGLPYVFGGRNGFVKWLTVGYYVFAVIGLLIGTLLATAAPDLSSDGDTTSSIPRIIALVIASVAISVSFGFAAHEGNKALTARSLRNVQAQSAPATAAPIYSGPLIPPAQAEHTKQWGTPGRGLNDANATPFTERNAELGFGGEVLTSQLMDPMMEIPGVRLVHGINLPGYGEADIDHVILCGDLLVAVDSKHWPGGNYYWLSEQIMCSTPRGNERRGNPMSWGLPTLQQNFPNKRLIPVVVIHSHDGGAVATNNRDRGTNPVLMTPLQFVQEVGRLCVDQHAKSVDPVALTKLVNMMAK